MAEYLGWLKGKRGAWITAFIALAGLVAGWWGGGLPSDADVPSGSMRWSLPSSDALIRYHSGAFNAARAGSLWLQPAGDASALAGGVGSVAPGQWQLVGVVPSAHPYALILSETRVQHVAAHAKLPGGQQLEQITQDSIWYTEHGCLTEMKMFSAGHTAHNKNCEAAPGQGASTRSESKHD